MGETAEKKIAYVFCLLIKYRTLVDGALMTLSTRHIPTYLDKLER